MIIGISGKFQSGKDTTAAIIQWLIGKRTPPLPLAIENYDAFLEQDATWRFAYSGWEIRRFADKLKQMVCILLNCTMEQLEDASFKETQLGPEWDRMIRYSASGSLKEVITIEEYNNMSGPLKPAFSLSPLTPRKLLQLLGTDCGRKIIHPNIWINGLMSDYRNEWKSITMGEPNWIVPDVRFPEELSAIKNRGGIVLRLDRDVSQRLPIQWEEFEKAVRPAGGGFIGNFYDYLRKHLPEVYKSMYHETEVALDNYKGFNGNSIYNSGSVQQLSETVRKILVKNQILKWTNDKSN